jgi:alpha-galactosidase
LKTFLNPSRTEESGDWMLALHGRTPPRHMEALDIPNNGHIANLPANSIVEVPGDIDTAGARGYAIGALPAPIASLCQRMLVAHEAAVEACVHADRAAALRSLAFEPTVRDLYVIEDLLDDLLTVNARYLAPEFVAKMKKRDSAKRVALVEPAADNPMRPDAPLPPGIPAQDVLTGAAWGANLGNLSDADETRGG